MIKLFILIFFIIKFRSKKLFNDILDDDYFNSYSYDNEILIANTQFHLIIFNMTNFLKIGSFPISATNQKKFILTLQNKKIFYYNDNTIHFIENFIEKKKIFSYDNFTNLTQIKLLWNDILFLSTKNSHEFYFIGNKNKSKLFTKKNKIKYGIINQSKKFIRINLTSEKQALIQKSNNIVIEIPHLLSINLTHYCQNPIFDMKEIFFIIICEEKIYFYENNKIIFFKNLNYRVFNRFDKNLKIKIHKIEKNYMIFYSIFSKYFACFYAAYNLKSKIVELSCINNGVENHDIEDINYNNYIMKIFLRNSIKKVNLFF